MRRLDEQAPWMVFFPGLAISLAVFGLNLLGDAIWDETDRPQAPWWPRLSARRGRTSPKEPPDEAGLAPARGQRVLTARVEAGLTAMTPRA